MMIFLKQNRYLAIIPARGGSKRVVNKNILDLNGKPLISYTIEAGLNSKYIDKVVVSSDSDKILRIAKQHNAQTIKRPDNLANDTSSSFDAVKHTIENLEKFEYIILLQPTSPLRTYKHIDEAIELLQTKDADAIISVSETEHNPLWSNIITKDKSMKNFLPNEIKNKRSQDLEKYYRLNGAIYICKTDILLKQETFFIDENIFAYEMSRENSIDIDTRLDFIVAEAILAIDN